VSIAASPPKDPRLAEYGRAGARRRWAGHPPAKVVRLDALTEPQRALVLALIEAKRVENEMAAAETQDLATAEGEGTVDAQPAD